MSQGPSNQRWRGDAQGGPADPSAPASTRGRKLAGLVMLLAALAGALAALFLYLRETPSPDFVALAIREYRAPVWPTNAMALQDALLLEKRFGSKRVERPYNVQE